MSLLLIVLSSLGCLAGFFAGLFPGLHTNVFVPVVVLFFDSVGVVFLLSFAACRCVCDVLPAVFLGASDEQNVLSVLPGHKFFKQGRAVGAVRLCLVGSFFACVFCLVLLPFLFWFLPFLYGIIRPFLWWVLLLLVLLLVCRSFWSVVIFLLSGVLGLVAFRCVSNPLFAMLSGLFGVSGLVLSLFDRVDIVQSDSFVGISKRGIFRGVFFGFLCSFFVSLFPGFSPSQFSLLLPRLGARSHLVLVGALGVVDIFVSLVSWFTLGKARSGAVVGVEQLIGVASGSLLFVCFVSVVVGVFGGVLLSWWGSVRYARLFGFVDYSVVCWFIFVVLLVFSFAFSGWRGVLLLFSSACVGLIAPLVGVSRTHAMGCLVLPTLVLLW